MIQQLTWKRLLLILSLIGLYFATVGNWSFGAFYWSETRDRQLPALYYDSSGRVRSTDECVNFFRSLSGHIRLYNEWVSGFPYEHHSNFTDQRLLGFGWYYGQVCGSED